MSKKTGNRKPQDDLESLSLTGSHVGTPVPSARKTGPPRTPTRPSSAQKSRAKPVVHNGALSESARGQCSSNTPKAGHTLSGRSESGKKQSARDEFLALFESTSQGGRPRTRSKQKPTPAWASTTDSARSVQSVDSGSEHQSKTTSKVSSKFSHSIFMPVSARSTSTVDTDDGFNLNVNLSSYGARFRQTPEYDGNHYKDVKACKSDYRQPPDGPGSCNGMESPGSGRDSPALVKENGPDSSRDNMGDRVALSGSRSDGCNMNCDETNDVLMRTYSVPVCNNEILNSHVDVMSHKAMKLNSIANNMTSQAFSGGAKAPLHSMQNSYQNIKPKTPVNEVRQSPSLSTQVGRNIAEDYIKKCNMAATKIQRWYRRHQPRLKAGEAAMKRLLQAKRQEKEIQRNSEKDLLKMKEGERKKAREERARLARQQAIEELQRKREEKRLDIQRKAEEEISFLQASGKIKRSNIKKKTVSKNKVRSPGSHQDSDSDSGESDRRNKPGTDRSVGKKVDDIFQSKNLRAPDDSLSDKDNRDKPRSPLLNNEMDPYSLSREPPQGAAASGGEGADDDNTLSPSQAATRTTLDDLMQTLKKLEEEDKFPTARKDKNEKPLSWLDDLEKTASDHVDDAGAGAETDYLASSKNQSKDNITKSGLLTDEKLHSIMSYLDEVDKAERLGQLDHMEEIQRSNQLLDNPVPLVPSGEEIIELEQASAMAAEVTNTMLSQRMELDEKKRSVQMLQKALNQQRELTIRHARETEKEMKKRLDLQKDEYEDTIKRHLAFIDQLIDDKKALTEKCEDLVKELKTVDKKYQNKIKSIQESHDLELKKIKDVTAAAEKLRRERWIEEKTKKIKEMTVKGLEPEIQRLISKHKAEIKKLKSIHEAELLAADERAGGRYIKMTEELRDQLAQEKEAACARERELARQTYEKQLQQEEEAFQQQRRRLYAEVQEEKERLAQQASRQRAEIDKLQKQLEESHTNAVSAMKQEYEKAREEQERRHAAEIKQLKDKLALEKQAWEENYKKKEETWLLQKERELKEQVRRERDKDIELVLRRLEEDNQAAREECERVAENRIKRIRDKYEGEIAELERAEKLTTSRYNKTKAELIESQGENERLKVILKQKEKEVQELKKLLDKLNEERDVVSDVIRQEFADKLVATDEENRRLKNEMSELKARHKVELERMKVEMELVEKAKNEEMEEVHKRVKAAILKKEEVVTQLRQQYEAAVKRADHLEGLLDQQRKQLLKIGKK